MKTWGQIIDAMVREVCGHDCCSGSVGDHVKKHSSGAAPACPCSVCVDAGATAVETYPLSFDAFEFLTVTSAARETQGSKAKDITAMLSGGQTIEAAMPIYEKAIAEFGALHVGERHAINEWADMFRKSAPYEKSIQALKRLRFH